MLNQHLRPRPSQRTMAERCIHEANGSTVQVGGMKLSECAVQLFNTEIRFVHNENTRISIPINQMCSIQVHQPIFGANYISGEYIKEGSKHVLTITFNKGGATEFARAFFRITEGMLVTAESTVPEHRPQKPHVSVDRDKKNV